MINRYRLSRFFASLLFLVCFNIAHAETIPSSLIESDTTWTKSGSPYVIDTDVYVAPSAALIIEPGTIVKLDGGSIVVEGSLVAGVHGAEKVVFTSYYDDSIGGDLDGEPGGGFSGDWGGIYALGIDSPVHISDAVIRYSGEGLMASTTSGIGLDSVQFEENGSGVFLLGGNSKLENISFSSTDDPLLLKQARATLLNSQISSVISGDAIIVFESSMFVDNVSIADVLGGIGIEAMKGSAVEGSKVLIQNIAENAILGFSDSSIRLDGVSVRAAGGYGAIEAFNSSKISLDKLLIADSFSTNDIAVYNRSTLALSRSSIEAGSAQYAVLSFGDTAVDVRESDVKGGVETGIGVYSGAKLTVATSTVEGFSGAGILSYSPTTKVSITGTKLRGNDFGILAFSGADVTVAGSVIADNRSYGINTYPNAALVKAEGNYWGDPSGPYHPLLNLAGKGNASADLVDFDPWLDTDPLNGCCSSIVFIPGIKGSVLEQGSDKVWPPTIFTNDISQLALNTSGQSVNDIKVDGILGSFYSTPIYAPFISFLDGLVSDGTIQKWLPLAYDWRFMPEDILDDGIAASDGRIDPIEEIEKLAKQSKSGKVTLIAHSMGGLLGKAIIKRLQEKGKEGLVESFVMVASPQLGTPQAAASLLHGHDEGILGGMIASSKGMRAVAQNMKSAFNLLPSQRYFEKVVDPVISMATSSEFTKSWIAALGTSTISDYARFISFASGSNPTRSRPDYRDLTAPEVLSTGMLDAARDFHGKYDDYKLPDSIRTVQIAGWGLPTLKDIEYTTDHKKLGYRAEFTIEGDGVVVYPSAVSSMVDETYYFNLDLYKDAKGKQKQHRDILSAEPVQNTIILLEKSLPISENSWVTVSKPTDMTSRDRLVISSHSPVILGVFDSLGNYTGIQELDSVSGILNIKEEIPGSSFVYFGENQYVFLPVSGVYRPVFQAIGEGLATIEVERFSNDTSSPVSSYTDIAIATSTKAEFSLDSQNPSAAIISVDVNGDGKEDAVVLPDQISLRELLIILRNKITESNTPQKIKEKLCKSIDQSIKKIGKEIDEKTLEKNKKKNDLVAHLKKITKKINKNLGDSEADEILDIIKMISASL